ncbi:MAG: hypothetical protein QM734_06800 [Cyclobacteriaceae bacterium]
MKLLHTRLRTRRATISQIPTGFVRVENKIYIHGSVGSFYMRELRDKKHPLCVSTT